MSSMQAQAGGSLRPSDTMEAQAAAATTPPPGRLARAWAAARELFRRRPKGPAEPLEAMNGGMNPVVKCAAAAALVVCLLPARR